MKNEIFYLPGNSSNICTWKFWDNFQEIILKYCI